MKKKETKREKELKYFYIVVIILMVFVSICSYRIAYKYRTAENEKDFYAKSLEEIIK